jgi:hypothetical protein
VSTNEQNKLASNKHEFYQEVTKNLNQYYYELKNIVSVKFIKEHSGHYTIEVYILNDEFDSPITIQGVPKEKSTTMITNITRDIKTLVALFEAYNTDISKQNVNQTTKEYVANLTNACIKSIERYEICTLAISDLSLPEYDLNYVIVGNLSSKQMKKDMTLTALSIRYTLKQLFPGNTKTFIQSLSKKYGHSFIDLCVVTDKNNRMVHH